MTQSLDLLPSPHRRASRPAAAPRTLVRSLSAAAATLCTLGAATAAHAQQAAATGGAPAAEATLAPVTVSADGQQENPVNPVAGFVARRALSATKTDTPLIETPQAISVVTRDQMEAQGAQTLRQTTAYTAGMVSNYFDSRVDSFKARGGDVTQYLDGLLRIYGTYNNIKADPYLLERVEFLRGPSSVLYGQGSVGGVLNPHEQAPPGRAAARGAGAAGQLRPQADHGRPDRPAHAGWAMALPPGGRGPRQRFPGGPRGRRPPGVRPHADLETQRRHVADAAVHAPEGQERLADRLLPVAGHATAQPAWPDPDLGVHQRARLGRLRQREQFLGLPLQPSAERRLDAAAEPAPHGERRRLPQHVHELHGQPRHGPAGAPGVRGGQPHAAARCLLAAQRQPPADGRYAARRQAARRSHRTHAAVRHGRAAQHHQPVLVAQDRERHRCLCTGVRQLHAAVRIGPGTPARRAAAADGLLRTGPDPLEPLDGHARPAPRPRQDRHRRSPRGGRGRQRLDQAAGRNLPDGWRLGALPELFGVVPAPGRWTSTARRSSPSAASSGKPA